MRAFLSKGFIIFDDERWRDEKFTQYFDKFAAHFQCTKTHKLNWRINVSQSFVIHTGLKISFDKQPKTKTKQFIK